MNTRHQSLAIRASYQLMNRLLLFEPLSHILLNIVDSGGLLKVIGYIGFTGTIYVPERPRAKVGSEFDCLSDCLATRSIRLIDPSDGLPAQRRVNSGASSNLFRLPSRLLLGPSR